MSDARARPTPGNAVQGGRLQALAGLIAAIPGLARATAPAAAETSTLGLLFQALLALLVVLAALFAFLWLLRRLTPVHMGTQGVVRVVGGVMLGTRERLVVVEVADQWLLLGVAAGRVNHLHTMPRPPVEPGQAAMPAASPFASKLAELLTRHRSG